ncbi:ADP-ribose 1''-phosphate phosphatase [Cytospora paraplurivora]|uniref:ADP-ribose 1''-phosphate phosphatase n=1 Tax=Cytospora paraplurivora TaxID=2898453 RepID=A0AAN9UHU7_9PEZI
MFHSPITSIASIPASPDTATTTFFLHATNCLGVWGTGIAKALKEQFPAAFEADMQSCHRGCLPGKHPSGEKLDNLVGTCHLIPSNAVSNAAPFSIVCLRTSRGYGRQTKGRAGLDRKDDVLGQTRLALQDFRAQLARLGMERQKDFVVWSPRINSGGFHIPWERTEELIEEVFKGWEGTWFVMTPL